MISLTFNNNIMKFIFLEYFGNNNGDYEDYGPNYINMILESIF